MLKNVGISEKEGMEEKRLYPIDGVTLMDATFTLNGFCVQGPIPQGLSVLGGAPKVGKSWLVLDLCLRVAKGEPLWNLGTTQGTVLYLCLEDTLQRVQQRLSYITEDVPANVYFVTAAGTLADDLEAQLLTFIREHPATVLIVIDTFQMIRGNRGEPTYGGDYQEMQQLKRLADSQRISILLVHHLRKQGDRDPVNRLSGTTGISGAADAIFILDRKERSQDIATLVCAGREIDNRELELRFSKDSFQWELLSDSLDSPENLLPESMKSLIRFMENTVSFSGSNTELAESFSNFSGQAWAPKSLKQLMNRWRYVLQEQGVTFRSYRSNGERLVEVIYAPAVTQVTQKTGP